MIDLLIGLWIVGTGISVLVTIGVTFNYCLDAFGNYGSHDAPRKALAWGRLILFSPLWPVILFLGIRDVRGKLHGMDDQDQLTTRGGV